MFNKIFNSFILIGMTISMVIITILKLKQGDVSSLSDIFQAASNGDTSSLYIVIAAFGSLMGVLSTVCSANAKILTFIFGFFDVSIYGIMCLLGAKYANGIQHLVYFVPMQFIGFWQWRKRGASAHKDLKARRLDSKKWLLYGGIFLIGLIVSYIILSKVGASEQDLRILKISILADAFSMMCNILGQMLMSMAYMEQWIFWIGVNVASVLMWSTTLAADPSSDFALVYIIKYGFYFINSINGLRIWIQLSKTPR